MNFYDAWVMAAVAAEIRNLVGARVQDVIRTSEESYELELYAHGRRHYLLISLAPQDSRLHFLSQKARRGADPSPLQLSMKKHLMGARVASIVQPPFERVLRLMFQTPSGGFVELVAEVMGRYSNLILLDEAERILGLHKVVGSKSSRERQLFPGMTYTLPPRPNKKPLPLVSEEDLVSWIEHARETPLWKVLIANVWGLSRPLAEEVVFRASGAPEGSGIDAAGLMKELRRLVERWAEGTWEPHLLMRNGVPWGYTPFRYLHLDDSIPVAGMSACIEKAVESGGTLDPYAAVRDEVRRTIETVRKRLTRQRESLLRQMKQTQDPERWKEAADWILAYAGRIKPRQRELRVEETGDVFELDPGLSAVENAQRYIKRYQKARRAAEAIPSLLESVEGDLTYLNQLEYDLDSARDRGEIDSVLLALVEAGFVREEKKIHRSAPRGPRKFLSPDGFTILVGKNARQNDEITFRRAGPKDIWLHARKVPGAHVVILTGGEPISDATLEYAAKLAAYYSKARGEKAVDVIYTNRKHVRRVPGGHPGQVLVSRSGNITVPGEKP